MSVEKPSWKIISVAIVVIISAFIRLHHIEHESLWMDELRQVSYYHLDIAQVVQGAADQSQPPLDYIIGHFIYTLSQSDFAVRLPAALFGIGAVWFITMIVSRLCSWPIALLIGILSALLPFNIYYSQEARPYSIAIFLFLTVLWSIDASVSIGHKHMKHLSILIISSSLFLYSRALSPLVVIVAFIFVLIIWAIYDIIIERKLFSEMQRRILLSIGALLLALILYAPCFIFIVKKSGNYLTDSSILFGFHNLFNGLRRFEIITIWKAFTVQTEPITIPIACLLLLSPYFVWKLRLWEQNKLFIISLVVLPVSLFLDMIIFHGKTNLPFRAPYAIYLLPLSLILSSVSLKGIWEMTGKMKGHYFIRSVYIVFAIFLILVTVKSAMAFKQSRIKSDWRGVSDYLNSHTNSRQVLIYQSLKPYGRPTFNGFFRYYTYGTDLVSMAQLPYIPTGILKSDKEPVIILSRFREYYLTSNSKYPILPLAENVPGVDMEKLEDDDNFYLNKFIDFYVIRLKKKDGRFSHDAYAIIKKIIDHTSKDSSAIEFYLAASALAKINNQRNWEYHLYQAEMLSGGKNLKKVQNVGNQIRGLN